VQIAGPALDLELRERDPAGADELLDIYDLEAPSTDDLEHAAALIDQVIPCP
jgi:hypothetical protein